MALVYRHHAIFALCRQLLVANGPTTDTGRESGYRLIWLRQRLGLWAIQPRYQSANRFGANGLARVRLGARYGAINMAGKTVINFNFSNGYDVDAAILSMGKGRMRGIELWEEQDSRTGLYGYLDYYGTWFIKPQYYRARAFNREGYAVVEMKRGQWGAIDRNNRVVIQPAFTSPYDAENALRRLMGY